MPRKAKELSPLEVRRLTRPGRWSVGGTDGLALQVTPSGARSWVLRVAAGGRQREMGLGSFPSVTLADARNKARQHRALLKEGVDPIASRRAASSAASAERQAQKTFAEVAAQYIAQHEKSWKSAKHQAQWAATLRTYAEPSIGKLLVRDIRSAHVIALLEPIWTTKTETATRVRSRIELVLDYAAARGYREGLNPARWKGNLDAALPNASKVAPVRHHAAVEVREVVAFMKRLGLQDGVGARALEFSVLTAARSGEVRGATWSEVDLRAALWKIPGVRMKSGREHRVPLSRPAIRLLRALPGDRLPEDYVFPGMRGPLSDMSLTAVLRRMGVAATAHGFRSTFRDWVSEYTEHSGEVAEMALSHVIGDKVEAAYRRGDLLEKRVALMADWASFLSGSRRAAGNGA
ncbi:MAG: integrase arm-type DNA-binding domain-containing protein [Caldimonas sp.]